MTVLGKPQCSAASLYGRLVWAGFVDKSKLMELLANAARSIFFGLSVSRLICLIACCLEEIVAFLVGE